MGFKEEFEKARKAGKETFVYSKDGKKKNTMKAGENEKQWKAALEKNRRGKKTFSKKQGHSHKKKPGLYDRREGNIFSGDARVDKLLAAGLDTTSAYNIKEAEEQTGRKISLTSGHRPVEVDRDEWDKSFAKNVKGKVSKRVAEAIRKGNSIDPSTPGKRMSHSKAKELVRKAGGGSKALNILANFRNVKAAAGTSRHTKTRSSFDMKKNRSSRKVQKWLEKNKGFREHDENRDDIIHLEKRRDYKYKPTSLGEIREKERGLKSEPVIDIQKGFKAPKEYGKPAAPKPQPAFIRDEEMEALARQDEIKESIDPEVEALEDQEKQYIYEEAQREFPAMDTGVRLAMRQRGDEGAVPNKSFGQLLSKKQKEEEELIPEGGIPVVLNDEEKAQLKADEPVFSTPQGQAVVASRDIDQTQVAELKKVASKAPVQESRGLSDDFKDAMSFFAPALIGGVIGGIFEGGAGAQAGIETGHSLGQAFRKHQDVQEDRKLRRDIATVKAGKKDIGTFVDSKTGNPIYYDRKANQFKSIDGKVVPQNRAVHGTTFRQTRRIDQQQKEEAAKQDRFMKRFDLDKQKLAQWSPDQVNQLKDYEHVLFTIDRMAELKKGVDTGILANQVGSLLEAFDLQPKGFTKLKSASNDSLAKYVKSISGAQVSELEAERLGQIIPTTADNDETFKLKLEMFKEIVTNNKESLQRAIRAGQPLKKLIGLEKAAEKFGVKLTTEEEFRKKKKAKNGFSREEIEAMKERIRKERQAQ